MTGLIRPMTLADLDEIVSVHLASFTGFFLTLLGRNFLRLMYDQIWREGVVLVACSAGQINGFVAGVLNQAGFYRRLVERQKWAFARAALRAALRHPSIVPRLFRALRRPVEAQNAAADACLMSIAVRPEAMGLGLGQDLVKAFCAELTTRGIPAVCLTTDRDHNERVNAFYQQLGFQLAATFVTSEERAMNEYVITLPLKS